MSEAVEGVERGVGRRRIRFVGEIGEGDVVLMGFEDPRLSYAVLDRSSGDADGGGDVLEVVVLAGASAPAVWGERAGGSGAAAPVYVKHRGVEVMWRPGDAVLQCDAEQAEGFVLAIVEFAHYERELRRIETEIAGGWGELEEDKALAFEVTAGDLRRSEAVGGRMGGVFARRIRYARIEPHLYRPDARFAAAGYKLGEELREKAEVEARLEAVDGQLEVFEHVYEMASQRMGEYRAAHEEHFLEWVIIVLLGAEALLMLVQTVLRVRL